MSEGSANDFENGRLNVGRSAVRQLNASVANVEQSAVQRLTADTVNATNSAFGVTRAATVEVRESAVAAVVGDYVRVEDSKVFLLLAPRVSGNVRAFLTLQSALALGAAYFFARLGLAVLRRGSS